MKDLNWNLKDPWQVPKMGTNHSSKFGIGIGQCFLILISSRSVINISHISNVGPDINQYYMVNKISDTSKPDNKLIVDLIFRRINIFCLEAFDFWLYLHNQRGRRNLHLLLVVSLQQEFFIYLVDVWFERK